MADEFRTFEKSYLYVVVENTPGYMPESDDPLVTDSLDEAKQHLADEVERYAEQVSMYNDSGGANVTFADDGTQAFVSDPDNDHDLGRIFSIELVEGELEAEE